eukprot:scaffold1948_cov15-Tisochrysis_lutea.AAC.1
MRQRRCGAGAGHGPGLGWLLVWIAGHVVSSLVDWSMLGVPASSCQLCAFWLAFTKILDEIARIAQSTTVTRLSSFSHHLCSVVYTLSWQLCHGSYDPGGPSSICHPPYLSGHEEIVGTSSSACLRREAKTAVCAERRAQHAAATASRLPPEIKVRHSGAVMRRILRGNVQCNNITSPYQGPNCPNVSGTLTCLFPVSYRVSIKLIRVAEEHYLGLVTLIEDIAVQERRHRILAQKDAKAARTLASRNREAYQRQRVADLLARVAREEEAAIARKEGRQGSYGLVDRIRRTIGLVMYLGFAHLMH